MGQIYHFHARDNSGRPLKGSIEAYSELDLIHKLQNSGYTVTHIEEKQDHQLFVRKIPNKEMAFLCRQLSSMIRTGVPIVQAIQMVEKQLKNKKLKAILNLVVKDLLNGEKLSKAFQKHERYFPSLFINMLYASEESGELDHVLTLLAESFQRTHQVSAKIRGAFAYPIVIIIFANIVSLGLILFALPTFLTMFENSNAELPLITKVLLFIHNGLMNYGLILLLLLCFLAVIGIKLLTNISVRRWVDRQLIGVPFIGMIISEVMVYRFSQCLHDLYKSGVSIDKALEITAKIISNKYFSEEIHNICTEIRSGVELGTALERRGIFPNILVSMVKVGEETGDLDSLLDDLATYTRNELDMKISQTVSLIEPLLLIFIGLLVGSIIIGIMLPMYDGMTLINQ